MPQFDVQKARESGYTDAEIADHIAFRQGFDIDGARKAGYGDTDIINRLTTPGQATQMIQRSKQPIAPTEMDARRKVAEDQSVGDAVLIGAGRTFNQVGAGVKQMYNAVTGDEQAAADLKAKQEDENHAYDALQNAHPVASSVGEALPSMVVPVGGAGGALATAGKLAMSGAVPAALEYGTPEERAKRAAGGAAGAVIGGQVVPKVLGAAGSVVKSIIGDTIMPGTAAALRGMAGKITPEAIALAEKAKAMGIPVNMSQLSDSKFLKTLESVLEQMPLTGGSQAATAQKAAYNKAIAGTFGADVEKITPEIYNFHKSRLGSQFDELASRNNLNVTPDLRAALTKIATQAEATGSDDSIRAVRNILGRVTDQAETQGGHVPAQMSAVLDEAGNPIMKATATSTPVSAKLPGSTYQSIDSELGNIIKAGGEKGMYAKEMQNAIRGAMDQSITPADQALWAETRSQYKNLKAVRNAVAKDDLSGEIAPGQLMNALNNTEAGKEAMAMGSRGTLGDLAQIGKRFVSDKVPNSGTSQRSMATNMIGGGSAGIAGAVAPMTTLGVLAGGATMGRTLNTVINSPKVVEALSKQGLTVGQLANLPPSKVLQIVGGITGMSAAELLEN